MNVTSTQGVSANAALYTKDSAYTANSASAVATVASSAKNVDTFERTSDSTSAAENMTYEPAKKLSEEQIEALVEEQKQAELAFFADMVNKNVSLQSGGATVEHAGFTFSTSSANTLIDIFGSMENALPTPATTPEGALASISEGGAYSVEAVSERLMKMATTFAAGDPEVLEEMREAVIKGFEAAGLNIETGEGMPDITMETFNHVMGEFDKLLSPEAEEGNGENSDIEA